MLVTGIIGAFASTASYLQERKKRKAEKAKGKKQEMKRLQIALESAQPQIQHEYDVNFARIGPRFAAGDGVSRPIQYSYLWLTLSSNSQGTTDRYLAMHDLGTRATTSHRLFCHANRVLFSSQALRTLKNRLNRSLDQSVSTASYRRTSRSSSLTPK